MADEEGLRRAAVRRYVAGETAREVAEDLGRSSRWVHKWVARFRDGSHRWFESASRAPESNPERTPEGVVAQVVEARRRLEKDPRAQRGATAVAWQLHVMGVDPDDIPPARTIERIISKAGLAKPRRRVGSRYRAKGVAYPCPAKHAGPGVVHEADPVGPRWLDGGQQVHSFNVMDVGSHRVAMEPLARQKPVWLAQRLVEVWRRLGIPEIVQLDNHSNLRGAIDNPRRFGPVVATALSLGVTPRFVPLAEPWRQGAIERFQDTFDKNFFRAERFTDLDEFTRRAHRFESFHNARHHYSALKGATPDQAWTAADLTVDQPGDDLDHHTDLPDQGRIEAIRFIRSDAILNLFGEHLNLPDTATYSYVTATIFLATQQLVVTDIDGQILLRRDHPVT